MSSGSGSRARSSRRRAASASAGLLFLGAPGTGKTMLAKAIATNFNSPFVTIPGSGFAATFIGIDVIVVMWLIRKAKKLARKWGGQCIVFIDEIDAVGMRRQSLGAGGMSGMTTGSQSFEEYCFFGPWGSLTPTGDLILETRAWRERIFAAREERHGSSVPAIFAKPAELAQRFIFPGGMGGGGGGLALNQLLVQMDGIGEAPAMRRFFSNKLNTVLDAMYFVPRKIGKVSLRLPAPKPSTEQVFFIGATNVPIDRLDPALIRPGRMGRHVWFRTPTLEDRKDIFNLYLKKVDHDPDLDTDRRRDELARITNGYAPAMIEQVCSLALTYSHADGRQIFGWPDIVEAMTTVEAGTAVAVDYIPDETRAVAIHEAGHAVNGHLYMKDVLSTRLSIRKRGESLGHHQAIETQERFSSWRSDEFSKLVWTLGAMAAEHVFYGENSTGVGGDVMSATARAGWMVGYCAMGPNPIDLVGRFANDDDATAEREKLLQRFEDIGVQIMRRSGGGGPFESDPIAGALNDRDKRRSAAALLGQAYVTAYVTILATETRSSASPRRSSSARRCMATRSSTCSTASTSSGPRSTCSTTARGRRYDERRALSRRRGAGGRHAAGRRRRVEARPAPVALRRRRDALLEQVSRRHPRPAGRRSGRARGGDRRQRFEQLEHLDLEHLVELAT